ncbi:MAG TPA: type II secretion system protein GspL [Pseudomonadales bacterium]|nr:type II secretion system protein GspL [Pseudomonadales bacterium]
MADYLFIRFSETLPHLDESEQNYAAVKKEMQSVAVEWALYQHDGLVSGPNFTQLHELGRELHQAYTNLSALNVVVIIPATAVSITELDIPAKQPRQILQAVPFMLEDMLADDLESVHLTIGSKGRNGTVPVAVVSKMALADWLLALRDAGVEPDYMLPENLLLPQQNDGWSLLVDQGRAVLRTGLFNAYGFDESQLAVGAGAIMAAMPPEMESVQLRCVQTDDSDDIRDLIEDLESVIKESGRPISLIKEKAPYTAMEVLCEAFITGSKKNLLNLLQGEFKAREKRASSNINWKPVAILLGIWAVLQLGQFVFQSIYYTQKANAADQQAKTLFMKMFPDVKKVVDVRSQMKEKLSQGSGASSADFLSLMADTGQQIYQMNLGKTPAVINLQRMSFDDAAGDLRLDVKAKNFQELENLKKNLEAIGMQVELPSALQEGDQVSGRVKVRR